MRKLTSLEEANAVTAVRLTKKRRVAKAGDLFRLSPEAGIVLWGRLIKKAKFFGVDREFNLVYVYDAFGTERPEECLLRPDNLLIGPTVVNNLGWSRGYWEIMASEPLASGDVLDEHLFVRFRGYGGRENYDLVDESGEVVKRQGTDVARLGQSGFGNFNSIDWTVRGILEERGLIAAS